MMRYWCLGSTGNKQTETVSSRTLNDVVVKIEIDELLMYP